MSSHKMTRNSNAGSEDEIPPFHEGETKLEVISTLNLNYMNIQMT